MRSMIRSWRMPLSALMVTRCFVHSSLQQQSDGSFWSHRLRSVVEQSSAFLHDEGSAHLTSSSEAVQEDTLSQQGCALVQQFATLLAGDETNEELRFAREALLTQCASVPLSADPSSWSTLLLLAQCICGLLKSPVFAEQAADVRCGNEAMILLLRQVAINILVEYGPYMIESGRTARKVVGFRSTAVVDQSSGTDADDSHDDGEVLPIAKMLLAASNSVLELQPPDKVMGTIRSLALPSLTVVQQLSNVELCDLATCLARTCRASEPQSIVGTGILSFEEQNQLTVLAGEVIRRLRLTYAPRDVERRNLSKSPRFSTSLAERKKREAELQQGKEHRDGWDTIITMTDVAELSTAFGSVPFRDSLLMKQSESSSASTTRHFWAHVTQFTVMYINKELTMLSPEEKEGDVLTLSFSRKDIRSVCFALDRCGQDALYDQVMSCLVDVKILPAKIPPPSKTLHEVLHEHSKPFEQ